ncbi:MAG: hypothetical protein IAE80_19185, partial [Anaerolinea sp.]|nr:hypothetical protein [Anaerolinea sp.]
MPSLFRTTRVPILIVLLTAIFVSASFAFANQLAQDVPPVETVELTSAPDLLTATPVETAETTSEPEVPITPEASPSPTFDETAEPEVPNPEPPIEPVIEEPFVIGAILGVEQVCGYPLSFIVTNTGSALSAGANYEVINVSSAQLVKSGVLPALSNGESSSIPLNIGDNPYDVYEVFISSGGSTLIDVTLTPCQLPTFTLQQVCNYPLAFELTNTGTSLIPGIGAHYEIINVTKSQGANSGLINTLAAGATTTLQLNVGDNPYDSYSIAIEVAGYQVAHFTPTPCQLPTFT